MFFDIIAIKIAVIKHSPAINLTFAITNKTHMSLIRIVKMTFHETEVETFRHIFEERKERIASFPGCTSLELLNDKNIFFTYSKWDDAEALEAYRQSELFQDTWSLVKKLFSDKPEAWSVRKIE